MAGMPGPRALRAGAVLVLALGILPGLPAPAVGARRAAPPLVRVSVGSAAGSDSFIPRAIEVAGGGRVEWAYGDGDGDGHSITAQPGEPEDFDSHPNCRRVGDVEVLCMEKGDAPFSFVFDREGDYEVEYYCRAHGKANVDPDDPGCGMCGRVHVVATADPGPGPTRSSPAPKPTRSAAAAVRHLSTPTPGVSPDASGDAARDERALAADRGGGGGGRVGLALLFWFLLGMAARQVWRIYIEPGFAPSPRAPRGPRPPRPRPDL